MIQNHAASSTIRAVKSGIAPELVVSQVKNTAAWIWSDRRCDAATFALDRVAEANADRKRDEGGPAYLKLLLAAHYATVATFVPTDVDARIRHHAWVAIPDEAALGASLDVVDEVAAWDVRAVSARFVEHEGRTLSGHDGEWLSVRSGALGRAASLGAKDAVERLAAAIDAEVEREERILTPLIEGDAPAKDVLPAITTVAHNLGDLSRVVDAWPKSDAIEALRPKWSRLGHPDGMRGKRSVFVLAGAINKALMAKENHRFLALRKPRALRTHRSLLLPFGPWFDAWGESIAKSEHLEQGDRAEVLAALLELHAWDAEQQGCLRAIAGLHRATRGGIELFVPDIPARMRKDALRGAVRAALDVEEEHFIARIERRYRTELDRLRSQGFGGGRTLP